MGELGNPVRRLRAPEGAAEAAATVAEAEETLGDSEFVEAVDDAVADDDGGAKEGPSAAGVSEETVSDEEEDEKVEESAVGLGWKTN